MSSGNDDRVMTDKKFSDTSDSRTLPESPETIIDMEYARQRKRLPGQ
ncbi:MAG: hypothetical protein ACYC9J_09855 [Sulfuricaulis sp.]